MSEEWLDTGRKSDMAGSNIKIDQQTNEIVLSFSIDKSSIVSAGLYTNNSELITPIFSGKNFPKGNHTFCWDKKNFLGKQVAPGNYQITITTSSVLKAEWEGVVANTSIQKSGLNKHGGYLFYTDLCTWNDKLFLCNNYCEGRPKQFVCDINKPNEKVEPAVKGVYITPDTYRLCTDGKKVYYLSRGAYNREEYVFIFAVDINNFSLVNFPSGQKIELNEVWNGTYSAIGLEKINKYVGYFTDIAVQVGGKFLFLAVKGRKEIAVYDKESGILVKRNVIGEVNRCTCDTAGNLWVAFAREVRKYKVTKEGVLASVLALNGFSEVGDICVSPDGTYLIVSDAGASQQLKAFSTADSKLLWVKGQLGGYKNGPEVTTEKFYFGRDASVAVGYDNSFFALEDGNSRIQKFNSRKEYVESIMYMPMVYALALDYSRQDRFWIAFQEFAIDYSKTLTGNNGSWRLVNNWRSNNDYDAPEQVYTISGHTYALIRNTKTGTYWIVELVEKKGIRLTKTSFSGGIYQLYADGIWTMDCGSNMPGANIYWHRYPLIKVNEEHDLVFGEREVMASVLGKEVTDPNYSGGIQNACFGERIGNLIISFEGSDGMYDFQSKGYHLGAIPINGKNYKWKTAYETGRDYNGPYPTDERYDNGSGTTYAGSRAKVAGDIVVMGQRLAFWKQGDGNEYKMYYKNGAYLGGFGTNIEEVRRGNTMQSPPEMAINAFAMAACRNGDTIYLYHGDEGVHSGAHRWKITGYNSILTSPLPLLINDKIVNKEHAQELKLLANAALAVSIPAQANKIERYPLKNIEDDKYIFIASYTLEKDYTTTNLKLKYTASEKAPAAIFYLRKILSLSHLDTWTITFQVLFDGSPSDRESYKQKEHNGRSAGSGAGFCLRDNNGKEIFVLDRHLYFSDGNSRSEVIAVNDITIVKQEAYTANTWYPVLIRFVGNTLGCSINNSPLVTIQLYSPGANAENIHDYGFEAVCSGQGFQRDTSIYIKDLQLHVDK